MRTDLLATAAGVGVAGFLVTFSAAVLVRKAWVVLWMLVAAASPIAVLGVSYPNNGFKVGAGVAEATVSAANAGCLAALLTVAAELTPTAMRGLGTGAVFASVAVGGLIPGLRFINSPEAVLRSCAVPAVLIFSMALVVQGILPSSDAFHLSHLTVRHRQGDGVMFVRLGHQEGDEGHTLWSGDACDGGIELPVHVIDEDADGL